MKFIKKTFILVLITLSLLTSFTLISSNNNLVYADKDDNEYKTTDSKPTYTETLNKNNKLLEKLTKKENPILAKTKEKGKDWIGTGVNLIENMKDDNHESDIDKTIYKTLTASVAGIAGIWGFGNVATGAMEGIEELGTSGEVPLSELAVLTDDMYHEFNNISDKISEVQLQMAELSKEVSSSTNAILSTLSSQINNLDDKQTLRSFSSSGEGNFSYIRYSNYLYGVTGSNNSRRTEAYYNLLLEAILNDLSPDVIKYYYDKLYDSITSNINILEEYYFGEVSGLDKSIAKIYYDYLNANPKLIPDGTTAEYEAMKYAYELYTTLLYSYELIEMCNQYQLVYMKEKSLMNNEELDDDSFYIYNNDKDLRVYYSYIMSEYESIKSGDTYKEDKAETQIVEDIAYIFGLKDSYMSVDQKNNIYDLHTEIDYYNGNSIASNIGYVADNQTIYLNKLSDELCKIFKLDVSKFTYYINDNQMHNPKEYGIINTSDQLGDFTASVKYDDVEIYSIDFYLESKTHFSGGSGSESDPYLISNVSQFLMIEEEMDACYKLVADVEFSNDSIYPIGTYNNQFNGTLDGNGYTIYNLNINSRSLDPNNILMTPTTGLFGVVGESGEIKNIILSRYNVLSDYNIDQLAPQNDNSYYYIGGIAGINYGEIYNCNIIDSSSINVYRYKDSKNSRCVEVCVGGIAGLNNHKISNCTIDGLIIDAESHLYYYNESIETNKHSLYVAGIAARTNGEINNCRVSDNNDIFAFAKSIADSSDKEKPHLKVRAAGIIAEEEKVKCISKVYVAGGIVAKCAGEIYNEGTYLWYHQFSYKNQTQIYGDYYPAYDALSDSELLDEVERYKYEDQYQATYNHLINSRYGSEDKCDKEARRRVKKELIDKRNEKITKNPEIDNVEGSKDLKYDNVLDIETKKTYNIGVLYECDCKTCCDGSNCEHKYNAEDGKCYDVAGNVVECHPELDSIYAINSQYLLSKHMVFTINGQKADVAIVGNYGFDTSKGKEDTNDDERIVKLILSTIIENEEIILFYDYTYKVVGNKIINTEIINISNNLYVSDSVESIKEKLFNEGFTIKHNYANGDYDAVNLTKADKDKYDVRFEDESKNSIIITNKETNDKYIKKINLSCEHSYEKESDVKATCQNFGYEVWKCIHCSKKINKNVYVGHHNYIIKEGVEATCQNVGTTNQIQCEYCEEIFEASEAIQILPHEYKTFESDEVADGKTYSPLEYHKCITGNHYESHQFIVYEKSDKEGNLVYVTSCLTCDYVSEKIDTNIITNEKLELPTLFVTDGYVLNSGDVVVVYVQILNNPGFNGANFGIRYTEGLELVSFEEEKLAPKTLSISNEVYDGYNFLWATSGANITEDGSILKLTFKVNSEERKSQTVSVVYGMNTVSHSNSQTSTTEGGFTTANNSEVIRKFITKAGTISFVKHLPGDVDNNNMVDVMDAMQVAWNIVGKENVTVDKRYADVNLDGKVDLRDVVAILQYISGCYGTNLLNSEYKVILDLAGYECEEIPESVIVNYYDENGNINNWDSVIDFEEYKEYMNKLGYNFVGWSTRRQNGNLISTQIAYDNKQNVQTLYAVWEKNKIIFDINGATSEAIEDIEYLSNNYEILLDDYVPELSYQAKCIVDSSEYIYSEYATIYKEFLGWDGFDGNVIDLSKPNLGTITVSAKWSNNYVINTPKESRAGYEDISEWYFENVFNDQYLVRNDDSNLINNIYDSKENNYKIYSKSNYIEYTINYLGTHNADTTELCTEYTIDTECSLLQIKREGYNFIGWYKDDTYNEKVDKLTNKNFLSYANEENVINLTAKWETKVYTVSVMGLNDVKVTTIYYKYGEGYYKDKNFTEIVDRIVVDKNYEVNSFYNSVINNNGRINFVRPNGLVLEYLLNESNKEELIVSEEYKPILNDNDNSAILYALYEPKTITVNLYDFTSEKYDSLQVKETIEFPYNDASEVVDLYKAAFVSEHYNFLGWYGADNKLYIKPDGSANIDELNALSYQKTPYALTATWERKTYDYDSLLFINKNEYKDVTNNMVYSIDKLSDYAEKNCLIIADIDMDGTSWTSISTYSGTLDGGNHSIYNFKISMEGTGSIVGGFINTVSGTVKNLIIGKTDYTTSFKYDYAEVDNKKISTGTFGILCGENEGTINNCIVRNVSIEGIMNDANNDQDAYLYVGGIAGSNYSIIKNCKTESCSLKGSMSAKGESADNNLGHIGGITANNDEGTVENCEVNASKLDLFVDGNGFFWGLGMNFAYPEGKIGGLVGINDSGKVLNSSVYSSEILLTMGTGAATKNKAYYGKLIGQNSSGTNTDNISTNNTLKYQTKTGNNYSGYQSSDNLVG